MKNIAVFASGSGTNFEAIIEAVEKNEIKNAKVVLLVCDKKDAYVIKRANNHNVPTFVFNAKDYKSKNEFEKIIVDKLDELKVDLVCLAGYMRYIGEVLLASYEGKIINIHPALLPSFKGAHGIVDAYNYGVKVFGVTIHFVDSGVDSGKIIAQQAFNYIEGDTVDQVEEKIHEVEHELYPKTINKLLNEEK